MESLPGELAIEACYEERIACAADQGRGRLCRRQGRYADVVAKDRLNHLGCHLCHIVCSHLSCTKGIQILAKGSQTIGTKGAHPL